MGVFRKMFAIFSRRHGSSVPKENSVEGVAECGKTFPIDMGGSYHKLSEFMGAWPTMSIFRRFGTLNVQNILFLQAELAYLEDQLSQIRQDEPTSNGLSEKSEPNALQSWHSLSQQDEDGMHSEQYEKVLEIRAKLKEYSRLLTL